VPNPDPIRGARIHDIARELGITSKQVLQLARETGADIKSPSSQVTEEQAAAIKAAWHRRVPPRPDWQAQMRRDRVASLGMMPPRPIGARPIARGGWDSELAPVAEALGAPAPRQRRPPREPEPELPPLAHEARRRWSHFEPEKARTCANEWVRALLAEKAEVIAWWDAGMPPERYVFAAELARRGVTPDMLGVEVHRRTIRSRIVDEGLAVVEDVVRLLQRAGRLPMDG